MGNPPTYALFTLVPPDSARHARRAVEADIAAAREQGRIIAAHDGLLAVLLDVADRIDMLRTDPGAKAAYAVVAVTRTLQDLYTAVGITNTADSGRDALDSLIEAFEEREGWIP